MPDCSGSLNVEGESVLKMSQDFEGPTHSGEAFLEFVFDLLEYAIPKYEHEWNSTNTEREFKKFFNESFGDAIILFRNRHKVEFRERLNRYFQTEIEGDIVNYSDHFCERTFRGKIPLMELIAYCAFLLDASLFYLEMCEPSGVHLVIELAFGVFYKYVQPYFTVVGGWNALYQVAEQYVKFVNFTPSSKVSEPASEVTTVSKL